MYHVYTPLSFTAHANKTVSVQIPLVPASKQAQLSQRNRIKIYAT